ncbi:MAG: M48 family metallopeptidase [bacterium]|nr:M48 family metallopeptidase [bacterium]
MRRRSVRFIAAGLPALLIAVAACYTNPQTGRKGLMLVSVQEETQLGFDSFAQIKNETPQSNDATKTAQVRAVGERIAAHVHLPQAEWEFVLFQADETPNAFCLPGGKVGVYSGILPLTQSDAGLATVIGHEIAHAAARHGGERMSQALVAELGGVALSVALQNKPEQTRELAMTAYGVGATVGVILPYSRKHELEADQMGLMYMAKAGYDPREAVAFWQRFKAWSDQQGGSTPEWLSTHPLDTRRISELEKHLPEAIAIYENRG